MAAWSSCVSPQAFRELLGAFPKRGGGCREKVLMQRLSEVKCLSGEIFIIYIHYKPCWNSSCAALLTSPCGPTRRIHKALVYSTAFQKRQRPVWWQGLQRRGALLQLWWGFWEDKAAGDRREVRRQNRETKSYVRNERGAPAEIAEFAILRRDLRIYFDQASDVKVLHGGAN